MPLDKALIKTFERDVDNFLIKKIDEVTKSILGKEHPHTEDDHFRNNLLFDSLDYSGLIIDTEVQFNVELDRDNSPLHTRKDMRTYTVEKIIERVEQKKAQGTEY